MLLATTNVGVLLVTYEESQHAGVERWCMEMTLTITRNKEMLCESTGNIQLLMTNTCSQLYQCVIHAQKENQKCEFVHIGFPPTTYLAICFL